MTTAQRIRLCLLIEKMTEQKTFCEKIGIENTSTFRRVKIERKEEKRYVDFII